MAAPTGNPDLDILRRLEEAITDEPIPPAIPEDAQEIEIKVPPQDRAPAQNEPDDEEPPPIAAKAVEEGEAEATPSDAATAAEQGEDEVHTLSDLARLFEVEEAELLEHLSVDSENGESVPLGKVIEAYKKAPQVTREYEAFKQKEAEITRQSAELRSKTDDAIRELAVHTQALLDMTQEEFKDVNWSQLKAEDPSQYVYLKERQRERGDIIQRSIEKMKAIENERIETFQKERQANRSQEVARLHQKMPDWTKPDVANAAMQETAAFLSEAGFSQEEINSIEDHRYLLVAYEAAQYRKIKNQAPKKLDKLRGLPKPKAVLRSSARRDSATDAQRNTQKKMDRLRQTGDERDAARLFEELL